VNLYTMNMPNLENKWTALVFGAVFSAFTVEIDVSLIHYVIKTVIGGLIWLACQVWADKIKRRGNSAAMDQQRKKGEDEHGRESNNGCSNRR